MKKFIRDLKEKEHFVSPFLVTEKNTGTDRNGKAFMSVTLADSTGHLNGRMFEKAAEASSGFEVGDVVQVKGFVQIFQNRRQLIVQEIRKAVDEEYQMTDLVADLGGDPRKHMDDLLTIVESLEDPNIKQVLKGTLTDSKFEALLLKAPAAKTIHHAYRGGLLEHVHSIVKVMESLAAHYTFLDRDLLIFGAIYHDIGKIFELDLSEGIHYSDRGRLVGHMAIACEMIDQQAAKIANFPENTKDVLKHIVLSHHGKLEYGSPKLPMIAEAIVVAMIDDLDSKMNTLYHFLKSEAQNATAESNWTHYHPGFERYFLLDFFRKKLSSLE